MSNTKIGGTVYEMAMGYAKIGGTVYEIGNGGGVLAENLGGVAMPAGSYGKETLGSVTIPNDARIVVLMSSTSSAMLTANSDSNQYTYVLTKYNGAWIQRFSAGSSTNRGFSIVISGNTVAFQNYYYSGSAKTSYWLVFYA